MTNGDDQQQQNVFHSSFSIRSVLGEDDTVRKRQGEFHLYISFF